MKKTLKIFAIGLGIVLVLLVTAAIVLPLVIDPNDYRDNITSIVKEQTGRELKIDGKISLSLFPWIGAELNNLSLANAPDFGKDPFAEVREVGIKVKLLPLLRKDIQVDKVYLDGLKLRLTKNRAGRGNWEGLGGETSTSAKTKQEEPAAAAPSLGGLAIGGVVVKNSELHWQDQSTAQHTIIRNLAFKTNAIAPGEYADIQLSLDLESGNPVLRTPVQLNARLMLDLDKQTLNMPSLSIELAGLAVKATDVQGQQIVDAPSFQGELDIASFNPKSLAKQLGMEIETTDSAALTKLAFNSPFKASTKDVQLKNFKLSLDQTSIQGTLGISQFDNPAYRFDLAIDDIDVDRYLPPAAVADGAAEDKAAPQPQPVVIPLAMLRSLNADGSLRIQKFKAFGIRSTEVSTKLNANGGLIKLGPSKANLYGGTYAGAVGIDARGKDLGLGMDENLKGVNIGPLLKDMEVFENFSGNGDVALKLSARGLNGEQVMRTLNGDVGFALKNGAIQGADIIARTDELRAQLDQLQGKAARTKATKSEKTAFEVFSGTARITNGVAQNNDFLLKTPQWQAQGRGSANLVNENLDFQLDVVKNEKLGQACAGFPLLIKGAFNDLSYGPDTQAILKCQSQKALDKEKEKLKEKLREKGLDLDLFKRR